MKISIKSNPFDVDINLSISFSNSFRWFKTLISSVFFIIPLTITFLLSESLLRYVIIKFCLLRPLSFLFVFELSLELSYLFSLNELSGLLTSETELYTFNLKDNLAFSISRTPHT